MGSEENRKVQQLLGEKLISKSTAVVQLYTSQGGQWQHIVTGVACLSKDSNRRSFYIQVINMDQSRMQWEQEIYAEIQFKQADSDSKIFTFEAENSMVLLSFADQKEANEFNNAIEERKKQILLKSEKPSGPAQVTMRNQAPSQTLQVPGEKVKKKEKKPK